MKRFLLLLLAAFSPLAYGAVGLNADGEYIVRTGITSGDLGVGGFQDLTVMGWYYRPSTATYTTMAGSAIVNIRAGARDINFGFDSTGVNVADPVLQIINAGDGWDLNFAGGDQPPFDEWVFYAVSDTAGTITARWRTLSNATWHTVSGANTSAGSQFANDVYIGSEATTQVAEGHYAFWRAIDDGKTEAEIDAYVMTTAAQAGDFWFWPLANNTDTSDGTGNGRTATLTGTLTSETDPAIVTAELEQEGFRWGVDDGAESAHTFEAAQDTSISIADTQARLLRVLVNGTLDTASSAYTLRYQKNGAGGYAAVPVGSSTASSITNQTVAASADDAQQSGTTMTLTGTTIGASLDANTEWVGMRFTNITIPPGATITSAALGVVPSGTGEDEPEVLVFLEAADDCATFTTGASDITNRSLTSSVAWSSANLAASGATYHDTPSLVTPVQAVIDRVGWASGNDLCVLIQGGQGAATRDLTIEAQDLGPNTNPPRLSIGWTSPNEVYVSTSANITAGGEATTARLTAPAGKTTSDFTTGRRWDDENGTDSIDIATDDYTEVEWPVFIAASAAASDFFDFRVYAGLSALDDYTLTPRWTIPGASTALSKIIQQH